MQLSLIANNPFPLFLLLLHPYLTNTLTCTSLPPPHGHNAQDWVGSIPGRYIMA